MEIMKEIQKLREEINKVDTEIVALLSKRIELVLELSKFKKQDMLPVEDLARESEILSKLSGENLDDEFIRELYLVVFSYSKSKQV